MTSGRPPKPAERKRLAGNPGKRPLPLPTAVVAAHAAVPRRPASLGKPGAAAWAMVWRTASAWLAPSDAAIVELLCQAVDQRASYLDRIEVEGLTSITEKGYIAAHPLLPQVRQLERDIASYLASCGLTPAERTRLGLVEVRRASKLEELRAQRSADRQSVAVEVAEPSARGGGD